MKNSKAITLSAEELGVLAGILDYRCVSGVDSDMPARWKQSFSSRVAAVISRLEKKKIIGIGLDGKVVMPADIHRAVSAVCDPDAFAVAENTSKRKIERRTYCFRKDETVLRLTGASAGSYTLRFMSDGSLIPSDWLLGAAEAGISVTVKDWYEINESLRDRGRLSASEELRARTGDKAGAELLTALAAADRITLGIYKRKTGLYEEDSTSEWRIADGALYRVRQEGDIIVFSGDNGIPAF